jgi:hypothetical protein
MEGHGGDAQVNDGRYDGAVVPRRGRFHLPRPSVVRLAAICLPVVLLVVAAVLRDDRPAVVDHHQAFKPTADTYVNSELPRENFGMLPVVRVAAADHKTLRTFLRFDLRGLSGKVLRATLSLYPLAGSHSGILVSEATARSWDERAVTFARSPTVGAFIAHTGPVVAERWTSVDVTSVVRGDGPVTLALTALHPPSTTYASRESVNAPVLDIHIRGPSDQLAGRAGTDKAARDVPKESGDPVVVAAGNIACDPADKPADDDLKSTGPICQAKATADLAAALRPSAVLALGDLQYDNGTLEKFRSSYDLAWGRLRRITRPVPGHREYLDASRSPADGYFSYFGPAAGDPAKGWYSYDLGGWHLIALNSECDEVGSCTTNAPQLRWLRADLEANQRRCTLAYWNRPRFSSGQHGGQTTLTALWHELYGGGADVVLSAHAYDYERFAPQDPFGRANPVHGIRAFVVGTGGRHLERFDTVQRNSERRSADTFGVLRLTLRPDSYDWQFVPTVREGFTDTGTGQCH